MKNPKRKSRSPPATATAPTPCAGRGRCRPLFALHAGGGARDLPPLLRPAAGAEGRARARQPLHAAGRGGAFGAGDRCRRQQGDAGAVRRRRHAAKDAGARRGRRSATTSARSACGATRRRTSIALSRSADPRPWRRGARTTATRWSSCPASAARPPMSCSTWRSASRPWRSTRISSASATGSAWRPARRRTRSRRGCCRIIPDEYLRHAHHWLILHGRYVCKARKPECPRCVIADICKAAEKTNSIPAPLVEIWQPARAGLIADGSVADAARHHGGEDRDQARKTISPLIQERTARISASGTTPGLGLCARR